LHITILQDVLRVASGPTIIIKLSLIN